MSDRPAFDQFVPERRFQDAVAVSPDGATVAYVTNDGGQFNLWTRSLAGGQSRQLTSFADESVRAVAWSPDGTSLAYAADRDGDEQYQIYVIAAAGGEPRRVSKADARQYDLDDDPFTPDGSALVYAGNDRDEMVQDLLIHDLATDAVRRVESVPGEALYAVGVSPDGRWLLGGAFRSNTDVDAFVLDLAAEAARPLMLTAHDGEGIYEPTGWLADSSGFYLLTNAGSEFLALAQCSLDGVLTTLESPPWDVEQAVSTRDGRAGVWVVNESGTSAVHAWRSDPSGTGGTATRVRMPAGVFEACDITPDGRSIVGLFGTGTSPRELVTTDLDSGAVTPLTGSRPPALGVVRPVEPVLVDFATHDGRRVPGWLYRPHGDGPCGVVLSIHGGPESQERAEYAYSGLYQFLVSRGIGVFAPNVRGSSGYGIGYQRLIHRDWGGGELGDFEHAVTYLAGLDWVDADRIGVFGGSFGGFATLSCVSRLPHLFAAGVSIVGPSNLVTFTKTVPPTWRPVIGRLVGDPEADHDFLMARSPISYVDQITAPLMVIQGANDPRVVKAESEQIVEALRDRGVEVRYDVYADEGHGFTKRSNEIKALSDVGEFLVRHLAD